MRQISMDLHRGDRRLGRRATAALVLVDATRDRQARSGASARDRTAVAHRAESQGETCEPPASSLTHAPTAGASTSDGEFVRRRRRRSHQDDLRAPPAPAVVPLGLVHDQAGGLQVVEPPLDAAPVRSNEARSVGTAARHRPPSHDRREPDDQLRDRRRVARRPSRMAEPEQVALYGVHARLQRHRPASSSRAHGRDRAARTRPGDPARAAAARRRPVPRGRGVSSGTASASGAGQREAARSRTDARGAAGRLPNHDARDPSGGRLEFGSSAYVGSGAKRVRAGVAGDGRRTRPGGHPVFFVPEPNAQAGRDSVRSTRYAIGSRVLPSCSLRTRFRSQRATFRCAAVRTGAKKNPPHRPRIRGPARRVVRVETAGIEPASAVAPSRRLRVCSVV